MKLQPALIFGEHMVLQRLKPVPVWGRSVRNDTVSVTLGSCSAKSGTVNGAWKVTFPPMEACRRTSMTICSEKTGERIEFRDIAIGEVWLAGGQSNMEFLLKYDEEAETLFGEKEDPDLRYFRYPTASFNGCLEKDAYPEDGFWRLWTDREDRGMFSAPAAYMGRKLREKLGVPVGFVGCHWGGTPAAAWTDAESLQSSPALQPVLDWHEHELRKIDLLKYYAASDVPSAEPGEQQRAMMDRFMMGIGLREFLEKGPPPMPPMDYTPYMPGPRSAVRPSGLYESMLCKVAPYALRGIIWYQGEDDDFRGWYGFYDESMKALIRSWRALWKEPLPFLQVELAPFAGMGLTAAKQYFTIRENMRKAADALPDVHNVCIMDAGDDINIHVRKKRPVGERLALLARKYVYGETELLADSPRAVELVRENGFLRIRFADVGEGLTARSDPSSLLHVYAGGKEVPFTCSVEGSCLLIRADCGPSASVRVEYMQVNYCEAPLFSSAGLPAFPFVLEVTA